MKRPRSPPQPKTIKVPPTLDEVRAELARRQLIDAIPWASPKYRSPTHLAPLLERLELAVSGVPQRVCCSAPPRHAKTESVLHGIAWGLWHRPDLTFSFTTYADRLSRSKSRKARNLAARFGVALDARSLGEWRTPAGGGLVSGGIGGPLTGHGVNIGIVDDPTKNRQEAESGASKQRLREFLDDVLETRIEPGGSIFIFQTRWTPDDLIGYALKKGGWTHINLPALDDSGRALWPERWPAEVLAEKRKRVGEYTFASLYQGRPRPRGGAVFGNFGTYSALPKVYQSAFGVDLAYTAKTSSDWSVAVRMAHAGGKFYVTDVVRVQTRAPKFKAICRRLHLKHPEAPWRWYASGTERGVADLFSEEDDTGGGVPIRVKIAKADKHTRAQRYAAAVNRGDVLVPADAEWKGQFLDAHEGFTGVGDEVDDEIDAAVAAFDLLDEAANRRVEIDENPVEPERDPWTEAL